MRVADGMYITDSNLTGLMFMKNHWSVKVYWAKKFGLRFGVAPYYGNLKTPFYQVHAAPKQSCHQRGKNLPVPARISSRMHGLAFLRRKWISYSSLTIALG
jgi:hypothetical protein